jgi:hypothetical protein
LEYKEEKIKWVSALSPDEPLQGLWWEFFMYSWQASKSVQGLWRKFDMRTWTPEDYMQGM